MWNFPHTHHTNTQLFPFLLPSCHSFLLLWDSKTSSFHLGILSYLLIIQRDGEFSYYHNSSSYYFLLHLISTETCHLLTFSLLPLPLSLCLFPFSGYVRWFIRCHRQKIPRIFHRCSTRRSRRSRFVSKFLQKKIGAKRKYLPKRVPTDFFYPTSIRSWIWTDLRHVILPS